MANMNFEHQEAELRKRVGWFLTRQVKQRQPMRDVLSELRASPVQIYLFGGLLRDLTVYGMKAKPRDIDIVVEQLSTQELYPYLLRHVKRETRFGGLHLDNQGWLFDVWPLHETWAFRNQVIHNTDVSELPKTTFLNVEAVVIQLSSYRGKGRCIYSSGFFEGISNKVVEINLEENPFPALCVVRSLITAARLQFQIGPRLARYIAHHMRKISMEELIDVQRHHYGTVKCRQNQLFLWHKAIEAQLRASKTSSVHLPGTEIRQLTLWHDSTLSR